MSLLYIIEDEPILADCIAAGIYDLAKGELDIQVYNDAISALNAIEDDNMPDVILLDVLLSGPDGFTLLNELISYHDTARIPVVVMTSLKLSATELEQYGIVEVLNKAKMTPNDIYDAVKNALQVGSTAEFQSKRPALSQNTQASPQVSPAQSADAIPSGLASLNQKLSSEPAPELPHAD